MQNLINKKIKFTQKVFKDHKMVEEQFIGQFMGLSNKDAAIILYNNKLVLIELALTEFIDL